MAIVNSWPATVRRIVIALVNPYGLIREKPDSAAKGSRRTRRIRFPRIVLRRRGGDRGSVIEYGYGLSRRLANRDRHGRRHRNGGHARDHGPDDHGPDDHSDTIDLAHRESPGIAETQTPPDCPCDEAEAEAQAETDPETRSDGRRIRAPRRVLLAALVLRVHE